MIAKEALRVYMTRTRKAMEDIDEAKISKRDRDRLEKDDTGHRGFNPMADRLG